MTFNWTSLELSRLDVSFNPTHRLNLRLRVSNAQLLYRFSGE